MPACPHATRKTKELLDEFRWNGFEYPSYSPDLAYTYCHLFPYLKQFLGGQRFASDDALKKVTMNCLDTQVVEFYNTRVNGLKLVSGTTGASIFRMIMK